jgi:hypothetical protein
MLLGACAPSDSSTKPAGSPSQLPYVPAEFQTCFRGTVGIPNKALTVAEAEALWKIDRIRLIASQRCGARFNEWYDDLRKQWK